MLAGSGLQDDFVEVLRLRQETVVEMPEDGGAGMAVRQLCGDEPLAAGQLLGQDDAGIHRRIDELHGLHRIFSTAGLEGR